MKPFLFWVVILVSAFLLWQVARTNPDARNMPEISYSRFISQVSNGQVSKVTISGREISGLDDKGGGFRVIAPPDQSPMVETLQQKGVEIWFKDQPAEGWPNWVLNLAPLVLLAALWFFMVRQMQLRTRRSSFGQAGSTEAQTGATKFGP